MLGISLNMTLVIVLRLWLMLSVVSTSYCSIRTYMRVPIIFAAIQYRCEKRGGI